MQARPARYVRVNGLSTGMTMDDVASTIGANPDGYVLPKCEGPDDIEALARIVAACGSTPKGILAICTETVRGVRRLMREDWSHPSLVGLTWGGEDLRVDLSAMANRDLQGNYLSPFVAARDLALLAAKEARVLAIDAVFTDFGDEAGLVRETRNARDMGFDGKLAIHPVQLQPIRDSFAPSEAEIAWAHGVIAAIGDGQSGVGRLDGVMVDRPHLKLAEKILGSADCEQVSGRDVRGRPRPKFPTDLSPAFLSPSRRGPPGSGFLSHLHASTGHDEPETRSVRCRA